jgi:hypothetical protein
VRIVREIVLVAVAASSLALAGLVPVAYAENSTQTVTVVTPDPDRSCAGDVNTLSWTRPADVAGLMGYRVVRSVTTMNPPWTFTDDVGPSETSLTFTAPFGLSVISVYTRTAEGIASSPFATGSMFAGRPPQPLQWDDEGASLVDSTATVPFRWPGPVELFTTGGLRNRVRVTASPGGASVELEVPLQGVIATFGGLRTGTGYTFSAVTSNQCGSSSSGRSPTYTPGIGPFWVRDTPPLRASPGEYVYKFAADGNPSPTYRLIGAPSWLTITEKGLVSGRPPEGTVSFSYSVVARNGVGIEVYQSTNIFAGPFDVSVWFP